MWSNAQFKHLRKHPTKYTGDNVTVNEASWVEQRSFLDLALHSLGTHPLADEIRAALKAMRPPVTAPLPCTVPSWLHAPSWCCSAQPCAFTL